MQNRRRSPAEITPLIEDRGLFKSDVSQVAVSLVPVMGPNNRGDFCVKGYVRNDAVVEVVFAGRRNRDAEDLERQLSALYSRAQQEAQARKLAQPDPERLRLPVTVEGSWRLRFEPDGQGWELRSYQLLAARWAFLAESGTPKQFGRPPEQLKRQGGAG